MSLLHPSKKAVQVLTYVGVFLCATMLIVGVLAAIFETAAIVRIYGGLTAAVALVVGAVMARQVWPQLVPLPDSSMPPHHME